MSVRRRQALTQVSQPGGGVSLARIGRTTTTHTRVVKPLRSMPASGRDASGVAVRRLGLSLIELTVVLAILSVVMTLSGALLISMSHAEKNSLDSAETQQTLARLNELFRRDVHEARSATVTEAQDALVVAFDEGDQTVVRYQIVEGTLQRQVNRAGHTHRDAFRVPHARWSVASESDHPDRVALVLRRRVPTVTLVADRSLPEQEWRLSARVGLTRAFAKTTGEQP